MILFEKVRLLAFNPPMVSEPMDLAAWEPGDGIQRAGTIAEIGQGLAAKYPSASRAGAGGFLSPGLVCAHTHLSSALARGLTTAIKPSEDFVQVLENLWWRLDKVIDGPILEASALAGCADALFSGVTSLVDHHASPNAIEGSLSGIRSAYETTGIRGILCYETTDRNGVEGARAGVAENLRFAKEVDELRASDHPPLVEAAIGAHAGFTVGDKTLEALADAVRSSRRGIHIHLAEDKFDAVDSRYRFGMNPVQRLEHAGALTDKAIIGHGLWLEDSDMELLNAKDAFLAHNARSNMNNAVGYASKLHTVKNALLGTDGMGADMLEEFKFAVFRHRESRGPWWPGDFLSLLDRGNRLMERYFGQKFGILAAGSPADLVHWDYDPSAPLSGDNIAGHIAFGMGSRDVRTVVVNGNLRIKDRKALFDIDRIRARAREQAARLWKTM
jgi:putative selenium metabolism protein SsnA